MQLTDALRAEYENLFNTCHIRPAKASDVEAELAAIAKNTARIKAFAVQTTVPWFMIAVMQQLEAGGNMSRHLHNGDPLKAKTVQVPQGRPPGPLPAGGYTWEESALDALMVDKFDIWKDWSLAGALFKLEGYNGFGYRTRHPEVLTQYLWSYSEHYDKGKYVADGTWSPTASSRQCGAAVILRRMAEKGLIEFKDQPAPKAQDKPLMSYAKKRPTDPEVLARATDLQNWLNTHPGIFVKPDGWPGDNTSLAFRKVTGHFLPGDPRETT